MDEPAFGFGALVTGGGNAAPTSVTTPKELRDAVDTLGSGDTATVIQLDGTSDYDLGGKTLDIAARNVTLRAGTRAVLKNVRIAINLDIATNILLQGLIFKNDGSDQSARDAITMEVSDPDKNATTSDKRREIRITHCEFSGYFDIAIDTKSAIGKPRLFMTIDHCLFFDSNPGLNGANSSTFVNRGAINISARSKHNADSCVTIANNVYVNVWRRCPRVAGGNFVHVFNNLLYHPGFVSAGSSDANNTTWRGIEVGGGDRDPDGSKALIEANRFIPTPGKLEVITTNASTTTDIATNVNEFDDPTGHPAAQLSLTASQAGRLKASSFYSDKRPVPAVVAASQVNWIKLVKNAGSVAAADADGTAARELARKVLKAAAPVDTTSADPRDDES